MRIREWLRRLAGTVLPSRRDDDLAEELRAHAALAAERGRRETGSLQAMDALRDQRGLPWIESASMDLRLSLRALRKTPVVTGAAVGSLALSIGACIAAFALVDALILRPLPVQQPEQLIQLTFPTYIPASPLGQNFSHPFFSRLRQAAPGEVELFAVSSETRRPATFADSTEEELRVRFVSGNAFDVLGVQPALGRLLSASDDVTPGGHPFAVISHGFWQRRFGGDPSIVGRTFRMSERAFEIVGVAPESFTGLEPERREDVWVPVAMFDARGFTFALRGFNWLMVFGRLKPGVDAGRVAQALQPAFTEFRREQSAARRTPLQPVSAARGPSGLRRQFARPLWILSTLVVLVLTIAASNIANLFLARAAAREREMSLRLSIGSSRARLVQQVLIEGLVLAAMASLIGLAFARAAAPAIVEMLSPAGNPVYLDVRFDWRVLAVLGLAGAFATMLFGLAAARRAWTTAPVGVLQRTTARYTGRAALPRPLVAVQVGVSLAVLFVATLFLLSFERLTSVELGFADDVLLLEVAAPSLRDPATEHALGVQLLERIRRVPGVVEASVSTWPLFNRGGRIAGIAVPGREPDPEQAPHLPVSPDFFRTMRIPFVAGRDFSTRDAEAQEPSAVIVSEAFVRRYLGGGSAVGRVYQRVGQGPPVRQEIVGVVADIRQDDVRNAPPPMVYVPLRGLGAFQVRTSQDTAALRGALEREVRATHPALRVTEWSRQSTMIANTLTRERLLALLSGFFAAVGLLLAAVGLYGVLNYSVVRRTREIGVRAALGARPNVLVREILRDVASMTAIGIAAGLAGGLYLSRLVSNLLHDVRPTDPFSIALPVVLLLLAAGLAAMPAAWRTSRLDPNLALRTD